ncbi:MAG TPA: PGDYG domain-containing protein [Steroidobacteraceae bacterium]|nr:PGDYG domain-containing protein [Steroidobacteraceae bacterium]
MALQCYRSTGVRGFSPQVQALPGLVMAHKKPGAVDVSFAAAAGIVQTREGQVHVHPGDAILTARSRERWRVSKAIFTEKYRPIAPTRAGEDGRYAALPIRVAAVPMPEAFEVTLADGVSVLAGRPGDWLVDYGDGNLGVIAPEIFASSYRIGE